MSIEEVPALFRVLTGRHEGKVVDAREIERLLSLKTGVFLRYEKARIHRCSACGHMGAWGPTWGWYGSINQIDNWDGEEPVIPKWCGEPCRQKLIAEKVVPRNMRRAEDEA